MGALMLMVPVRTNQTAALIMSIMAPVNYQTK